MDSPEVWDVTDAAGVPTGSTHVRGTPGFPSGRFHVVAATCVVDDRGLVLLSRRGPDKDFADLWEFPAGSALAGETSAQAAVRELREEVGLTVAASAVHFVDRFREGTALFDLYVAQAPNDHEARADGKEVSEVSWVDLDVVERRRSSHRLADPWEPRLDFFWNTLLETLRSIGRA